MTASSEMIGGISHSTPLPMGEGTGEGLVAFVTFHAPPYGGGDGGGASWLVYLFTSSSTPYTLHPQSLRAR